MKVNLDLLPVKLFYLCFFGGFATLHPFLSHYFYQLGFGPVDVTTVLGVVPLVIIFSRPLFAHLADSTGWHKGILYVTVLAVMIPSLLLLVIPSVKTESFKSCDAHCSNISDFDLLTLGQEEESLVKTDICSVNCSGEMLELAYEEVCNLNCTDTCSVFCDEEGMHTKETHFSTGAFWLFFFLVVGSFSVGGPVSMTLVDTMALSILKDKPEFFGRQRMFMTFGLAIGVIIPAVISDAISAKGHVNYTPSFVGLAIFLSAALVCAVLIKNRHVRVSKNEKVGMRKVLPAIAKPRPLMFLGVAFVTGVTQAIHRWLGVVFLKELGGSQTLIGVSAILVSLTAAVALMFSSKVIKFMGYEYIALLTLVLNSLRLLFWYTLYNPWFVLPIDAMMGVAVGLWMATKIGYAGSVAPKNAKASAQATFGAMDEGLGMCCGNFVSGSVVRNAGPRTAWLSFGIFGSIVCVAYAVGLFLTKRLEASQSKSEPKENGDAEDKPDVEMDLIRSAAK